MDPKPSLHIFAMSHDFGNSTSFESTYRASLAGDRTNPTTPATAPRILQDRPSPGNPGLVSTHQVSRKRQRPNSSRTDVTFPRKRAITACRTCRSRKVKCNNARPTCGNCEASLASCVYEDPQDFSTYVSTVSSLSSFEGLRTYGLPDDSIGLTRLVSSYWRN